MRYAMLALLLAACQPTTGPTPMPPDASDAAPAPTPPAPVADSAPPAPAACAAACSALAAAGCGLGSAPGCGTFLAAMAASGQHPDPAHGSKPFACTDITPATVHTRADAQRYGFACP